MTLFKFILAVILLAPVAVQAQPDSASVRSAENAVEQLLVRGLTASFIGDKEKAIQTFQQALSIDSDNATIHSALSDAYASALQMDLASYHAKQARLMNPSTLHDVKFAELLMLSGNPEEAVVVFTEVLESDSTLDKVRERRASAYLAAGDHRGAAADLEKLLDRGNPDPGLHQKLIQTYSAGDDADRLVRMLENLVRLHPSIESYWILLADTYEVQQDSSAAVAAIARAAEANPSSLKIQQRYQQMSSAGGQDPGGQLSTEEQFNRLVKLELTINEYQALAENVRPDSDGLITTAVQVRRALFDRQFSSVTLQLDQLLAAKPGSIDVWILSAFSALMSGDFARARTLSDDGLLIFRGNSSLLAIKLYLAQLPVLPQTTNSDLVASENAGDLVLGLSLLSQKQLEQAKPHLEKAAQSSALRALALDVLGDLLSSQGNSAEAVKHWRSAQRLFEKNPHIDSKLAEYPN